MVMNSSRVRIRDVELADMERDQALDRELVERLKLYRHVIPRRRPTCPSRLRLPPILSSGREPTGILMPATAR